MGVRRLIAAGALLACAVSVGTALAAPAGGGRHYPHFSVLDDRVALKELPAELRLFVAGPPGTKHLGFFPRLGHGPVWLGQVERPKGTFAAVAKGQWICQFEMPKDELARSGGICTSTAAARRFQLLDIGSCGKGRPTHFRIHALLPDGVTAVEVERKDGTIGRTVPVVDNTIAFTISRENIVLHGVGDVDAEELERNLPLATVHGVGGSAGCTSYSFFEEGTDG